MKRKTLKLFIAALALSVATCMAPVNVSAASVFEFQKSSYKQPQIPMPKELAELTEQVTYLEYNVKTLSEEKEKLLAENNKLKEENERLKAELELLKKEQEEQKRLKELTYEEWECLYRVARAEAGSWSKEAQKNVVYVVLNRLYSEDFPDNIKDIVFQRDPEQFACVWDGNYSKVEISDFTVANVQEAYLDYIEGESAQGARFFTLGKFKRPYLFTDEVGHNFYE